jgi:ethanolamine ammonia-lyase large subunit
MLNYQSSSFHDALYLREALGLRHAPEFESWLQQMQIVDAAGRLRDSRSSAALPALTAFAESAA